MTVTREQRHTKDHPCPICGGFDRAPRGQGVRCGGFNDGEWAHCTREEHAGDIPLNAKSSSYPHRLAGPCRCGTQHGRSTVMGEAAYETVAAYDYRGHDGALLFQVVRKRNPRTGAKTFLQRRPDTAAEHGWTWNLHGVLRVLYRLPELLAADKERPVYVVEGEKDVDRLLGLGLAATTNPGGAGKWAKRYAPWFKGRTVVVIPDNDDETTTPPFAGQRHAHEVARSLLGVAASVRLLQLPGVLPGGGDVSDWLDQGGASDELEELAMAAPEYGFGEQDPGDDGGRRNGHEDEATLEHTQVLWEGSRWRPVSRRLIHDGLLPHGSFIAAEGRAYYFDQETKLLCDIEAFPMRALLNTRYGVNGTETLYSYMREEMLVEAMERGTRATVHQFAHYDPQANVLYLDTGQGRVLRLDGGEIREQDNGTDGVLFTLPPNSEPWEYQPDAPADLVRSLLIDPLNFTDGEGTPHTAAEQRVLMLLWLLALAFEAVQPTKPLALALGPAGAGKSSIFRRIGKMLFGPGFDVDGLRKDAEEDFYVATTNRPLVVFDNVDRAIPWLDDALAQSATGMRITKRKLYENNTALSYVPKAFIALTARTPRFRREDVADRMVIFQLGRLKEKTPEYALLRQVLERRDLLLSDYARMLNRVVAAPGAMRGDLSIRLADFAQVALRAGEGLGLGHVAEAAVGKLKQSQAIYATEENDLFILLDAWLSKRPEGHMDWGQGNEGRRVATAQLYDELRTLAEASGVRWRFNNAVSLGKQLQALEEALGIHFRIERQHKERARTWSFARIAEQEVEHK